MRAAMARAGKAAAKVEPLVPVDLVVDHSVQVDAWGTGRRAPRRTSSSSSRATRSATPSSSGARRPSSGCASCRPGIGICHQVNLEFLATVATERDGVWLHDTVIGTDSHTTMVNGIGVVGWGVGGIEAEAAMLGPAHLLPHARRGGRERPRARCGRAPPAPTSCWRSPSCSAGRKVVGKFVEFHGEGAASLPGHRAGHHRQHGARVRRDHGLLPARRADPPLPRSPPGARQEQVDGGAGLPRGAGHLRHPARRARSTTARWWTSTSAPWCRRWRDRSGRRTASRSPQVKERFTELFSREGRAPATGSRAAELGGAPPGRRGRSSGTATWSSPPSPPAPTPPTRR